MIDHPLSTLCLPTRQLLEILVANNLLHADAVPIAESVCVPLPERYGFYQGHFQSRSSDVLEMTPLRATPEEALLDVAGVAMLLFVARCRAGERVPVRLFTALLDFVRQLKERLLAKPPRLSQSTEWYRMPLDLQQLVDTVNRELYAYAQGFTVRIVLFETSRAVPVDQACADVEKLLEEAKANSNYPQLGWASNVNHPLDTEAPA
jgi:hypothetical protein